MDCSPPGPSIHGIFQARVLEWVAIAFSVKVLYTVAKHYKRDGCDRPHRSKARGATPRPRPGVAAGRSYPISKELWLHGSRRDERSYSTFKIRKGGREEIPLIQGKEQRLCFAGAAMK